ncbi:alpha/beta hydrolase [Microbacterium sp. H1-D42]|uniref:alpha/beta hydrolase n=1 Tax=Microbacterium sp. H1-D42 TaxID=2925844 RepID=UPI001F5388BD|nr:alpha/beta hydrolase [Microbacterium sp. H1-D42]UNK70247.1 alpha/beta hydrolase family protein [Microbacterium sp. H1-D42]
MIDALRAELARSDLPEATRHKLQQVQTVLDGDPQARLQSFSTAGGEPRAVVSFGDVERADLVVYLLHGIDTGLDDFGPWAGAAQRVCADVIRACVLRGEPRDVATIAWFAWDSGTHVSALATRHATVGAAQLAVDIDKLVARNPTAHIALVTYSYSSTLLGELFAMNIAGVVRTAFSFASAGVTHAASSALGQANTRGDLVLYATEGANDSIAPLGRLGQHPIDPRDIPGVIGFDCDGGEAPGPDGSTVVGVPVEGHASQSTVDEHGVRHIGYYDGRAQGYLTMVSLLADAATGGR